jgi:polyhydroxybutyrate depolymerase
MKASVANLFFVVLLAASPALARAQGTSMTWTVDGVSRTALVFAPPQLRVGGGPFPLIFAFHGHGGTSRTAALGMHLQTLWPEAIVVYPQGLKTPSTVDPAGNFPGWQVELGQASLGDRDLKFFDAMLAGLKEKFPVDESRVYATGFSNGATFSYLLWAERGKALAALAICAGRLWPSEHLALPRAVVVIAGRADQTVPFALQEQTIEIDREADHATGPGQQCGPICKLYPSPLQTPVVTWIHPGGHVYPPWAPPAFVDFFKAHRRP